MYGRRPRGLPIETFHGDAQTADLPEGFDIATSRFGVMFFDDPGAAFANIAKALKPGGRMVFAAWAPVAVNPFWRVPAAIASARLQPPPPPKPNAPGPMGLADVDYLRDQLAKAGLAQAEVRSETIVLGHLGGAAAMAAASLKVGPASRIADMYEASEADRLAIMEDLAVALSDYEDQGKFQMPATLNIIDARVG